MSTFWMPVVFPNPVAAQCGSVLRAGGAYYRRLYEVNPKIRADWRDWNPLARQR
jgi:hypothetical protein